MASFLRPQAFRQAALASSPLRHATRPTPITSSILKASTTAPTTFTSQRTAFHNTARRNILPPLPQRLEGTANEAAKVPEPHPTEGGYHWILERAVSVLLIPVTVAPFVGGALNPITDAVFCALLVLHSHTGFQSVITDYIPRKRLPTTRKLFDWGLVAGSILVAYGLWEFETNDVGLTAAVQRIWKAGRESEKKEVVGTVGGGGPLDRMANA